MAVSLVIRCEERHCRRERVLERESDTFDGLTVVRDADSCQLTVEVGWISGPGGWQLGGPCGDRCPSHVIRAEEVEADG